MPNPKIPSSTPLDLLVACRVASDVRLYPTTWRVRLLLTSRVWDPELDTRVWKDPSGCQPGSGRLVGFAMLWRRQPTSPYLVLDQFAHPEYAAPDLTTEMLRWGIERAQAIVTAQNTPLPLYAADYARPKTAPEDSAARFAALGFTPLPPNPEDHNVYFSRPLQDLLPAPALPPGYTLRPLQSVDELEAYQAINGFAKVNPDHQRELFASDEYRHLVIVTPQGEFAAYCECSICRQEWVASGQRLGWIDYIETTPAHQKQGLGQAVLLAALSQLQAWGAETALLVTTSSNTPAIHLYLKTGFTRLLLSEPTSYTKDISPHENLE